MRIALLIAIALLACGCRRQTEIVYLNPNEIEVPARRMWSSSFEVPPHRRAIVEGQIQASGGGGNDIRVFVVDHESLLNLENGHAFQAFFQTDQTTAAKVHVGPLGPGEYFLV